jgi:hypothetical protein
MLFVNIILFRSGRIMAVIKPCIYIGIISAYGKKSYSYILSCIKWQFADDAIKAIIIQVSEYN